LSSSRKLIEVIGTLIRHCELNKAFQNVNFWYFLVDALKEFRYKKFLACCDEIRLNGVDWKVATTVRDIHKEIDEVHEWGECKNVFIWNCKLQGEEPDHKIAKCSKLKYLDIGNCNVTKNSFNNLYKWIIAVKEFRLSKIEDMKVKWRNVLVDAIRNGSFHVISLCHLTHHQRTP